MSMAPARAALLMALLMMVLVLPMACNAQQGGELGGLIKTVVPDGKLTLQPGMNVTFNITLEDEVLFNNTTVYWVVDEVNAVGEHGLEFVYDPGDEPGTHEVEVIVLYGNGTDYHTWDVEVAGHVGTFVITGREPGPTTVRLDEGAGAKFSVNVSDPDGQVTGYRWYVDGTLQLGAVGRTFQYSTGLDDGGVHDVAVDIVGGASGEFVLEEGWVVTVVERLVCSPANDTLETLEGGGGVPFLVGEPTFGPGLVEWSVDGDLMTTGDRFVYYPGFNASGLHQVTVVTPAGTRTWQVLVEDVPREPVISSVGYVEARTGEVVHLNVTVEDPDDNIALYEWDTDGDGTFDRSGGTMPQLDVKYSKPGDRVVEVRITDGQGRRQSASMLVHVRPAIVDRTGQYVVGGLAAVLLFVIIAYMAAGYVRKRRAAEEKRRKAEEDRKEALRKRALEIIMEEEAMETSFVELPEPEEFEGLSEGEPDTLHMKPYASRLRDRGMTGDMDSDETEAAQPFEKGTWTAEIRKAKKEGDRKEKRASQKKELEEIMAVLGEEEKKAIVAEARRERAEMKELGAETEAEAPDTGEMDLALKRERPKMAKGKKKRMEAGTGTGGEVEKARPTMKRKDSDEIMERGRKGRKGPEGE